MQYSAGVVSGVMEPFTRWLQFIKSMLRVCGVSDVHSSVSSKTELDKV